jgi:glycerol uptake facilitator-like aquaporin
MTHIYSQASQSHSRMTEIVTEVLSTTVLVLAGIIAVAQFAYY